MTWLGITAAVWLFIMLCMGYRRGFIKEIVSAFFIVLSMAVVWFINPYVNTFITENTPVYVSVQNACGDFVNEQVSEMTSFGKTEQDNVIESLKLPGFLKKQIEENNNADVYHYLAVNTFTDYVTGYLARAAVNGVSFLVSFILATLLIRIFTYALNIIASLPVLRGVNKAAGALVGLIKGVLFLWIIFIVFTVLCNTALGTGALELIEQDVFLSYMYSKNILMQIFMSIFYGVG